MFGAALSPDSIIGRHFANHAEISIGNGKPSSENA
jgi:hypothetical protein